MQDVPRVMFQEEHRRLAVKRRNEAVVQIESEARAEDSRCPGAHDRHRAHYQRNSAEARNQDPHEPPVTALHRVIDGHLQLKRQKKNQELEHQREYDDDRDVGSPARHRPHEIEYARPARGPCASFPLRRGRQFERNARKRLVHPLPGHRDAARGGVHDHQAAPRYPLEHDKVVHLPMKDRRRAQGRQARDVNLDSPGRQSNALRKISEFVKRFTAAAVLSALPDVVQAVRAAQELSDRCKACQPALVEFRGSDERQPPAVEQTEIQPHGVLRVAGAGERPVD